MLGFKLIKFKYLTTDGQSVENKVFFFGNPCENINHTYFGVVDRRTNEGIPKECLEANKYNVERIKELLQLNNLKNKNAKLKDNLGGAINETHILSEKIRFIDYLTTLVCVNILQHINSLMWFDTRSPLAATIKLNEMTALDSAVCQFRFKQTGLSLETSFEFLKPFANVFSKLCADMIEVRYDTSIMADVLTNQYNKMIEDYKFKAGYETHHKN